jgi:uncharacterized protein Yka (UPF0111/DUF47 family)
MLGWFKALMPKEDRFFGLFDLHAQTVLAGARALHSLLQGGDDVPQFCREVGLRENEADAIARDVLILIRRSFITPFDRSNITALIQAMDDAIDQMNQTSKTITLFEMRSFDPLMQEMGGNIVRAAELTVAAIPLLRSVSTHAARLHSFSEEIIRIEGRADDLHDEGLKSLFRTHRHSDPMAYLTGSEVYGHLERVVDRFEDVANEVNGIVIEHV